MSKSTNQNGYKGYIYKTPRVKEFTKELSIKVEGFDHLLITEVDKYYPINIYNEIVFTGDILEIKNSGDSEFDYKQYLSSIQTIGEIDKIRIISTKQNWNLVDYLSLLKTKLIEAIDSSILEPHSGLIKGILLGEVSSLDNELKDDLKLSGLYHIVSISGFNVSIIYTALLRITSRFMNRFKAILISIVAIVLFSLFIGLDNLPVLRATLMLSFISIGLLFGRKVKSITALIVSILIIILIYPYYIINISLLLSSLATLGIILLSNSESNLTPYLKNTFGEFKTSLAAITFTSLITHLVFNEINLLGLASNMLILPSIPIIMLLGVCLIVVKLLNLEIILYIFKILIDLILNIIYTIVNFISSNLQFKFESIFILFLLFFTLVLIDYANFQRKSN